MDMSSRNETLASLTYDWACRCFGIAHVQNNRARSVRLTEEAVELAQACDVPKEQLHQLIDIVYDRPKGDIIQELGGVLNTAYIMSVSLGTTPDDVEERELRRILAKPPEHFAKRNKDKLDLGLTG